MKRLVINDNGFFGVEDFLLVVGILTVLRRRSASPTRLDRIKDDTTDLEDSIISIVRTNNNITARETPVVVVCSAVLRCCDPERNTVRESTQLGTRFVCPLSEIGHGAIPFFRQHQNKPLSPSIHGSANDVT
jgi:hypothetical protein